MNELMIFEDALFGQVRTIMSASNEPLFCLSDVCRALEMKRFRIERLDKDVISNHPLQTAGGLQQVTFVNEDGLYDIVLDSRKPKAKKFRKWITSEVVPSIRKTGSYSVEQPKQLSAAESLLQSVQLLVAHERQLAIIEHNQKNMQGAISSLYDKVYGMQFETDMVKQKLNNEIDRYTVIGYCSAHNIPMTRKEAAIIGGTCSRMCKKRNIPLESIADPRFGKVNTYPSELIAEVVNDRQAKQK